MITIPLKKFISAVIPALFVPGQAVNKELLLLAAAGCWGRVMTVPNLLFVDEADDDDDPEYNFLEDLDEPDTEDFRNDRAVRITSKFPSSSPSFLGKVVFVARIFAVEVIK